MQLQLFFIAPTGRNRCNCITKCVTNVWEMTNYSVQTLSLHLSPIICLCLMRVSPLPKCQCIPELFLSPQDQCRGHYSSGDCVISSLPSSHQLPDWPRDIKCCSLIGHLGKCPCSVFLRRPSSFLSYKFSRKDSRDSRSKLGLNLDLKITSCFVSRLSM